MSKSSENRFVHLHVHSDFSLLDGAANIQKMVQFVAADSQPGLALTDHGAMGGTIQLFQSAKTAGITGIAGIEVYHVPDVTKMRERVKGNIGKSRFHMILLAYTTTGYQNLMRLSSEAHLNYFYQQPNVDDMMLAKYSDGIIAASGCLGSQFNQALLADKYDEAKRVATRHQEIYGRDNYFIEIQNHGIKDQLKILPLQLKIAKEIGAPLLATNDSHYLSKNDARVHDALLALQTGSKIDDENRFRFDGNRDKNGIANENYMRTAAEMWELFPHKEFPEACANTLLIEQRSREVDVGLPKTVNDGKIITRYLIPEFPVDKNETAQTQLSKMVHNGAIKRYAEDNKLPKEIASQVKYELDVIHDMGFDNYFLIVADIVQWAKSQGIRVGPGRGSVAGSIVAYCAGITGVDPIKYKLYFERFLNPGRKSMPDIDIDFEQERRLEVIQYVAAKYPGRVAYIATYGVLKPKSAMLGANRVMGNTVSVGQRLSGMWPGIVNQAEAPLSQIVASEILNEKWTDHWRMGSGLRKIYNDDKVAKKVIDLAIEFEGTHNIKGIHPAGLLITPGPLSNYVPLHQAKGEDSNIPVCAYDKDDAETVGGLKMDLLGLINLSVIGRTIELVKLDIGKSIDIDNLPLDDKKVYKMLSAGDSDGVFQLESPGMRDLLRRVKPETLEDLSAIIALFRPGPMGSNLHTLFADVKNGKVKANPPHKDMHHLLAETFSMTIYQEQLILLAQHYAGFDAFEADAFRKAVGKKDAILLVKQEEAFKKGVLANGYDSNTANKLWDIIPPFGAYAFNKAHSVAYAFITYQTAWLKVNYPAQYAAACIDYLPANKVFVQVESARRSGVRVSPPNINSSHARATTASGHVWLGIGGISNCGPAALKHILAARADGKGNFTGLGDFLIRSKGVNKKSVYSLISAGCFDSLHPSRKAMHDNLESMVIRAGKIKAAGPVENVLDGLFGELITDFGIKGAMDDFNLNTLEYGVSQRIEYEINALGFPASEHPFRYIGEYIKYADPHNSLIPRLASPVGEETLIEGQPVTLYGTVSAVAFQDAKGSIKPKSTFFLETDSGGRIKCTSFGFDNATLRDGDLMVANGSLRSYIIHNEELQEFRITASQFTSLDKVVAETKRLEVGGAVARTLVTVNNSSRPSTVEPTTQRTSRRKEAQRFDGTYTFNVTEESQVNKLVDALGKLDDGSIKVLITFGGNTGESDTGYDISEKKAKKIAERVGAKLNLD